MVKIVIINWINTSPTPTLVFEIFKSLNLKHYDSVKRSLQGKVLNHVRLNLF